MIPECAGTVYGTHRNDPEVRMNDLMVRVNDSDVRGKESNAPQNRPGGRGMEDGRQRAEGWLS
jgi:hypothetical protein